MENVVNPYIYVGINYGPVKNRAKTYRNTVATDYVAQVKSISNTDRLESILKVVCDKLGVTVQEAKGTIRDAEIVRARQIYCYMAKEMGYTFKKIGAIINRDHATVIYACKVVSNRKFDYKILNDYNRVIDNI
jgi:chromosomal replication initiation ATPase DnaA